MKNTFLWYCRVDSSCINTWTKIQNTKALTIKLNSMCLANNGYSFGTVCVIAGSKKNFTLVVLGGYPIPYRLVCMCVWYLSGSASIKITMVLIDDVLLGIVCVLLPVQKKKKQWVLSFWHPYDLIFFICIIKFLFPFLAQIPTVSEVWLNLQFHPYIFKKQQPSPWLNLQVV